MSKYCICNYKKLKRKLTRIIVIRQGYQERKKRVVHLGMTHQRTSVSILPPFPNQPGEQSAHRGLCAPWLRAVEGRTGAQMTGFFSLTNKNSSSSGILKYFNSYNSNCYFKQLQLNQYLNQNLRILREFNMICAMEWIFSSVFLKSIHLLYIYYTFVII